MAQKDYTQALADFEATINAGKQYSLDEWKQKFPEFGGNIQAALDYVATKNSGKYDSATLQSKFPEFFDTNVEWSDLPKSATSLVDNAINAQNAAKGMPATEKVQTVGVYPKKDLTDIEKTRATMDNVNNQINRAWNIQVQDSPTSDLNAAIMLSDKPATPSDEINNFAQLWGEHTEEGKAALAKQEAAYYKKQNEVIRMWSTTPEYQALLSNLQRDIASKKITAEEAQQRLAKAFDNQYGNALNNYRSELYMDYMRQAKAAFDKSDVHKEDWARRGADIAYGQNGDLSERIDAQMKVRTDEVRERVEKKKDDEGFFAKVGRTLRDAEAGGMDSSVIEELKTTDDLRAAKSFVQQANDMVDAVKNKKGFAADFGKAFGKTIIDGDTWDFGVTQLMNSAALMKAADKADRGAKLTKDEELLLEAAANYMAVSMYYSDKVGRGTKAGQTTAASIPFMLQFMATAGVGTAAANATTRGIAKFATKMLGKAAEKKGVQIATKVAGRAIGDFAYAQLLTNTMSIPKIEEGTISRMNGTIMPELNEDGTGFEYAGRVGQQDFGEAFRNAHKDQFIENYSEVVFGMLDPLKDPLKIGLRSSKMFAPVVNGIERNAVVSTIIRAWNNPTLRQLREQTRFGGMIEENAEEWIGGLMRLAFNTDVNTLQEAGLDKDSLIDTFLGLAPSILVMGGAGATSYYASQAHNVRDLRKSLKTEEERKLFDLAMKESRSGEFGQKAHDFLRSVLNDTEMSQEAKMSLFRGTVAQYGNLLSNDLKQTGDKLERKDTEYARAQIEKSKYQDTDNIYITEDAEGRTVCIVDGKLGFRRIEKEDGTVDDVIDEKFSSSKIKVRVLGKNGASDEVFEVNPSSLPNAIRYNSAAKQVGYITNHNHASLYGERTFTVGDYVYDTATQKYLGTKEEIEKKRAERTGADVTIEQPAAAETATEQADEAAEPTVGQSAETTEQPVTETTPEVEPINTNKPTRQHGIKKVNTAIGGKEVKVGFTGNKIYYNTDGAINTQRSQFSIQDENGRLISKRSSRYDEYVAALNNGLRNARQQEIDKANKQQQKEQEQLLQEANAERAAQAVEAKEQRVAQEIAERQQTQEAESVAPVELSAEEQEQQALQAMVAEVEQKHIKKDGTFSEDTTPEQQFVYLMGADKSGLADAVAVARESIAQIDEELADIPNNKRLSAANRMLLTKRKQAERQSWQDAIDKYTGENVEETKQTTSTLPTIDSHTSSETTEVNSDSNEETNHTSEKYSEMSDEEINGIMSQIEDDAEPVVEMELTPDNWAAQFGESGIVETPIGSVKMGENQYYKLAQKGRNGKLGMIKPTLENPTVVIEEKSMAKDGQETERASSYIFVKSFISEDGHRTYYFTSITVQKDGREVVISNQEKERSRIKRLLKDGRLAYIKEATLPSESNTSTQGNQPANPIGDVSEGKGTENNSTEQEKSSENLSDTEQVASEQPATDIEKTITPPTNTIVRNPIDLTQDDIVLLYNNSGNNRPTIARKVVKNGETTYYKLNGEKIKNADKLHETNEKFFVYTKVGNKYEKYMLITSAEKIGNNFRGQMVSAEHYDGTHYKVDTTNNSNNDPNIIRVIYREVKDKKGHTVKEVIGSRGKTEADYLYTFNSLDDLLKVVLYKDADGKQIITMADFLRMGTTGDGRYSSPYSVLSQKIAAIYGQNSDEYNAYMSGILDKIKKCLKSWNYYVERSGLEEQFAKSNDTSDAYSIMRERMFPKDEKAQGEHSLKIQLPPKDFSGSLRSETYRNPLHQAMVLIGEADYMLNSKESNELAESLPRNLRKIKPARTTTKSSSGKTAQELYDYIASNLIYKDKQKLKDEITKYEPAQIRALAQFTREKYQQEIEQSKANGELEHHRDVTSALRGLFQDAETAQGMSKIRKALAAEETAATENNEPTEQKAVLTPEVRKSLQERKDFLEEKQDFDGHLSEAEEQELAQINTQLAEFSIGEEEVSTNTEPNQVVVNTILDCLDGAGIKWKGITDVEIARLFEGSDDTAAELMAVNDKFNQQLEQYTDENADNIKLDCGMPSEGLLLAGIPNIGIRLNGQTLRKKIRKHGFTAEDLKDLPVYLQHPIAVFEGTHPNTYGVLIEMTLNGKNTLVAIDIKNAEVDGVTLVSSVYDKSTSSVVTWINKGMLLSVDKEKALRYIRTDAPIAPADNSKGANSTTLSHPDTDAPIAPIGANSELISAANIVQIFDTAKSFSDNSAEYQIVYHGSNALFDHFDHRFMGNGEGAQAYGWGTYVTQVREIGRSYAKGETRSIYNGDIFRDADIEDSRDEWDDEDILDGFIDHARDEIASERGVNKRTITYEEVSERLMKYADEAERMYEQTKEEFYEDRATFNRKLARFVVSDKAKQNLSYKGSPVLYEVEIPNSSDNNYLMYEQPIGEAAERIKRALYERLIKADPEAYDSADARKILWNELNSLFTEDVEGNEIYGNISSYLGSDMAASQFLNSMGYTGISYPAEYMSRGGREDGARNFVIFNEGDLDIKSRAELMKKPNGKVYGFAQNGVIYLSTERGFNPNTVIHEYTHLWARAMMQNNPEGWQSIVDLFKGTPLWDEVVNDPNYSNLESDDAICSEVLSRYSGKHGAERFERKAKEMLMEAIPNAEVSETKRLIQRMKDAIKKFWNWVGTNLFDIPSFGSQEEVADRVLWDLVNQTQLSTGKVAENLDSQKNSSTFAPVISKKQFVKLTRQIADKYRISYRLSNKIRQGHEKAMAFYDPNTNEIIIQTPIILDEIDWRTNEDGKGIMPEYVARATTEELLFHENIHKFFELIGEYHDNAVHIVADLIRQYASKEWLDLGYEKGIKTNYNQEEWDEELCTHYLSMQMQNGSIEDFLQRIVKDRNWDIDDNGYTIDNKKDEDLYDLAAYDYVIDILKHNNYETEKECKARDQEFEQYLERLLDAGTISDSRVSSLPDIEFSVSPEEREEAGHEFIETRAELFGRTPDDLREEMERLSDDADGSLLQIATPSPEFLGKASEIIAKACDRTEPIRVLMNNLNAWRKKNGQPPISDDLDVRTQLESVRSIVANKMHYIEFHQKKELREAVQELAKIVGASEFYQKYKTERVADSKGKPVVLTPIELIERYLICQDNIERFQLGIARGLPEFKERMGVSMPTYRDEFLEAFANDEAGEERIRGLWDKLRAMTDIVLNEGHESGLISDEKFEEMQARKFYIPERDFAENENNEADVVNADFTNSRKNRQLDAMKRAKGSDTLARSPLAFIEHDVQDAVQKAADNKVKLSMYRLLRENIDWCVEMHIPVPTEVYFDGNGKRLSDAPTREDREVMKWYRSQIRLLETELMNAKTEEEKQEIQDSINEIYDQMPYADSYTASQLFNQQRAKDPTMVGVYVNGALCEMKFPNLELLANALNGKFDTRGVAKGVQKVTQWCAAQFTVNNPTFFAVNLARDIPFVLAKGMTEYGAMFDVRFSANFAICHRAVIQYLWNKETGDKHIDQLLQDFLNGGGNMGFFISEDIDRLRADVRRLNPDTQKLSRTSKAVLTLGYTELGRLANMLNDYSEIITRFAAYKSVVDMGLGHNEGIKAAHNLSTNFNRKGLGTPFLNFFNSMAMFANAAIQGAMGFWRSFDNIKHTARALVAFGFMPALLGFVDTLLNPDDDDDEYSVSDFDRDNKVILGNWRIPLSEQMKPFWCIGVNAALAMRGRRNAKQVADSILSSFFTNLLPLPQNLTNIPTMFSNKILGGRNDRSMAQIIEQLMIPTAMQNVGQLADNRNFMGGKLRYDIGDIPEYTMADNEATLYKDLAYAAYCVSGGDKDIPSKHREDGNGKVWADINPKEIKAWAFMIPSGYMDYVCSAYGLIKSATTGTSVKDNVRVKDIPIINRFYSKQTPEMFRIGVAREARTMITDTRNQIDNYEANIKKNTALATQYRRMGLFEKADKYQSIANESIERLKSVKTKDYMVLESCYEAYKKASIASTAKKIGMDKKLFQQAYPDMNWNEIDGMEKRAVANMLTAIYINKDQSVDTKVAKDLQSLYGNGTISDYLEQE